MPALLIACDVERMGARHAQLKAYMAHNFPDAWHCLEAIYIVSTKMTPQQLRDLIAPTLGADDELLVVVLERGKWAWRGNTDNGVAWLRQHA